MTISCCFYVNGQEFHLYVLLRVLSITCAAVVAAVVVVAVLDVIAVVVIMAVLDVIVVAFVVIAACIVVVFCCCCSSLCCLCHPLCVVWVHHFRHCRVVWVHHFRHCHVVCCACVTLHVLCWCVTSGIVVLYAVPVSPSMCCVGASLQAL